MAPEWSIRCSFISHGPVHLRKWEKARQTHGPDVAEFIRYFHTNWIYPMQPLSGIRQIIHTLLSACFHTTLHRNSDWLKVSQMQPCPCTSVFPLRAQLNEWRENVVILNGEGFLLPLWELREIFTLRCIRINVKGKEKKTWHEKDPSSTRFGSPPPTQRTNQCLLVFLRGNNINVQLHTIWKANTEKVTLDSN